MPPHVAGRQGLRGHLRLRGSHHPAVGRHRVMRHPRRRGRQGVGPEPREGGVIAPPRPKQGDRVGEVTVEQRVVLEEHAEVFATDQRHPERPHVPAPVAPLAHQVERPGRGEQARGRVVRTPQASAQVRRRARPRCQQFQQAEAGHGQQHLGVDEASAEVEGAPRDGRTGG